MLSFTIGRSSISIFIDGVFYSVDDTHANHPFLHAELKKPVGERDLEAIRGTVTIKKLIERLTFGRVKVTDSEVLFENSKIGNYLAERMIEIMNDGIDIEPYAAFMDNVMDNPAVYVHDELYEWMEKGRLPITPDGHFLAFKKVRDDYMDCHTGMFDNSPGNILEMDRTLCDTNRHNHCSSGFHFASTGYLKSFGGSRVVVVKINPRDVTSIPSDYKFTKGRTCRYEVVAELTQQSAAYDDCWRKGVVELENPAEFPAGVLSKIVLPSPASNTPIVAAGDPTDAEEEAVEAACAAIEADTTDAGSSAPFPIDAPLLEGGAITADLASHAAAHPLTDWRSADVGASPLTCGSIYATKIAVGCITPNVLPTIERVGDTLVCTPSTQNDAEQTPKSWTKGLLDLAKLHEGFETKDGRKFTVQEVNTAIADTSIRAAARALGIQDSTLRGWIKKITQA